MLTRRRKDSKKDGRWYARGAYTTEDCIIVAMLAESGAPATTVAGLGGMHANRPNSVSTKCVPFEVKERGTRQENGTGTSTDSEPVPLSVGRHPVPDRAILVRAILHRARLVPDWLDVPITACSQSLTDFNCVALSLGLLFIGLFGAES